MIVLTSGNPSGRRYASGTCDEAVDFVVFPEGGEGFAEYSVSDKPLSFGVWGV